jgi:hypothetical protein
MSAERIVIVNDDPTLQTELEHHCADTPYAPYPQPWSADAAALLAASPPVAVVVHVPSALPPAQEGAVLAELQADPALRQIPVLVCSDRPAILQSAVQELQPRPGAVLASAPDAEELRAKLQTTQAAEHERP